VDRVAVERLLQVQQGQPGGSKAKEAQAAVKGLEAQQALYRQALQGDRHPGLQGWEKGLMGTALRPEVGVDGLQALADQVCEHVQALRGRPGWLHPASLAPPPPAPRPELPRAEGSIVPGEPQQEEGDGALGEADRRKLAARAEKVSECGFQVTLG